MMLSGESRLLDMRILQNFVRKTRGRWDADEWGRLIKRVRLLGFMRIDEERIRQLVEGNRERWLAGDNSVGPPAPVPEAAPAGPGPETERPSALVPQRGPGMLSRDRRACRLSRAQLGPEPVLARPGIPPWEPSLAGIDREAAAEASTADEPPGAALAPETAAPVLPAAATRTRPAKKARKRKGAGKAKKAGKAKAGKAKKSKKARSSGKAAGTRKRAGKKAKKKAKKKAR